MYDDTEVRAILQRAIELDTARRGLVTRDELVQIASELGVSESALRDAIEERDAMQTASNVEADVAKPYSALRILGLGTAVGLGVGVILGQSLSPRSIVAPFPQVVIALVASGLVMVSGGLALSDRTRSVISYVMRNGALWVGYSVGWALTGLLLDAFGPVAARPHFAFQVATFSLVCGGLTTLIGAVLNTVRRASRNSDAAAAGRTGGDWSSRFQDLKLQVLRIIKKWFSAPTSFFRLSWLRDSA